MAKQLKFEIPEHGGRRKGSGRKKRAREITHVARPKLSGREPLGITLKLREKLPSLRTPEFIQASTKAFARAKQLGLGVVHFSIQSNHLHLVVETASKRELETGMRSLTVALAKAVQRIMQISGEVFGERYHLHVLKTPVEVRNAVLYILFNWSKHKKTARAVDPFSSVYTHGELGILIGEKEWRRLQKDLGKPPRWINSISLSLRKPGTWLLAKGWRRAKSM